MKVIIKNLINRKFITKKNRKIYLTKKKNIYANAIYIKLLAIVILSIFIFYNLLGKYNYCYKCFEKQLKNIEPTCLACPNEYIFKGLKIISTLDTLNELIDHKKSISRIGDGEYEIIQGRSIHYQKKMQYFLTN